MGGPLPPSSPPPPLQSFILPGKHNKAAEEAGWLFLQLQLSWLFGLFLKAEPTPASPCPAVLAPGCPARCLKGPASPRQRGAGAVGREMAETRRFKRICGHRVEGGSAGGRVRPRDGSAPARGWMPAPLLPRRSQGCFCPHARWSRHLLIHCLPRGPGLCWPKDLKPSCFLAGFVRWARRPVISHPYWADWPILPATFEAQDREVGEGAECPQTSQTVQRPARADFGGCVIQHFWDGHSCDSPGRSSDPEFGRAPPGVCVLGRSVTRVWPVRASHDPDSWWVQGRTCFQAGPLRLSLALQQADSDQRWSPNWTWSFVMSVPPRLPGRDVAWERSPELRYPGDIV